MTNGQYQTYNDFITNNCKFDGIVSTNDIAALFHSLLEKDICEDHKKYAAWDYELFLCCEINASQRKDDQAFIYPNIVYPDGTCIPDIDNFEEERLAFYESRLNKSSTSLLRFRYFNYLLEKMPQGKQRFSLAKAFCEEMLDYVKQNAITFDICNSISRLIEVLLMYNLSDTLAKIDPLVDSAIKELKLKDEQSLNNNFVLLCLSQTIRYYKNRLLQIVSPNTVLAFSLALTEYKNYYKENNLSMATPYQTEIIEWALINKDDIKPFAEELGNIYELQADASDSNISSLAYYETALAVYLKYGISSQINHIKVLIKDKIRTLSESGEMKEHYIPLKQELIDTLEEQASLMIETLFSDPLEKSVKNLAMPIFIPSKNQVQATSKVQAQDSIFTQFVEINAIINGRSVFIGNDLNDHELFFFAQTYNLSIMFNFEIFDRIWQKLIDDGLTSDIIFTLFETIGYLSDNQKAIIKRGIDRFFADDYISSLHIMLPQYENAFRRFFESYGFATTNVSSDRTQKEQTFTSFIENDFVKLLSEDYMCMVDFVMVNNLGYNLRNNIAHGLIEMRSINKRICLMVLYLFFVLMGTKLVQTDESSNGVA